MERTTMNTGLWRACVTFLGGVLAVLIHEHGPSGAAHPPDLYRRTALYDRFLR